MDKTPSRDDEENTGFWSILSHPAVFDSIQRLMGNRSLFETIVRDYMPKRSGIRILDIGCGTGSLVSVLPEGVDHVGFDISPRYIAYAAARRHPRSRFFVERVSEISPERLGRFDVVMAFGILHHIGDDEARSLIDTAAALLGKGGRLVTVDAARVDDQSALARFFMDRDRGRHIRTPAEYLGLFSDRPFSAEGKVLRGALRIPMAHCVVRADRL